MGHGWVVIGRPARLLVVRDRWEYGQYVLAAATPAGAPTATSAATPSYG
jgi:hypothetical protein